MNLMMVLINSTTFFILNRFLNPLMGFKRLTSGTRGFVVNMNPTWATFSAMARTKAAISAGAQTRNMVRMH